MLYFKNCDCIEELKNQYRELCFKYHPDVSKEANANEIMKKVNSEYDELFDKLKNVFKRILCMRLNKIAPLWYIKFYKKK